MKLTNERENPNKNLRLWNKNFFLLWQGQLVSVLGDVLYMLALDLWILKITGSTGLMGLLSAVTMLPRIILGPFAGVFVDRWSRKNVIVFTDLIRGIVITFVGLAGVFGFIEVWMVFIAGVVTGLCSAFFNPAVGAIKPELVPEEKLVKANSFTSLADSGMNILGSGIAGALYVAIGAPHMFLFNGLSFLFSAFTEVFIKEPKREARGEKEKITFIEDLKSGFKFVWSFSAFKKVFFCAALINFTSSIAFVLIPAYFTSSSFLGEQKYGFYMALIAVGQLIGSLVLSVIDVKRDKKFMIYTLTTIGSLGIIPFAFMIDNFYVLCIISLISFCGNAMFNTLMISSLMIVIPPDKRGKVGALMNTLSGGLQPIGVLMGGVLGEIFPYRLVMVAFLFITLIVGLGVVLPKGVRNIVEYDSSKGSIDELIAATNGEVSL